ncbi:MAG: 30S ribosomal protein S13 [Candidatus Diapherotrites archaeon]
MAEEKQEKKGAQQKDGGQRQHKQPYSKDLRLRARDTEDKDVRYIVRIAGKDLDGSLPVYHAVQSIKGIGQRMGKIIAFAFEKESGIGSETPLGKIPEDKDKALEEIVLHPEKFGAPSWTLNKRRDFETGLDWHPVMNDWDFGIRKDVQRMAETKSYKGLRHMWGQPVRGQRTKSTHRGKGPVVGVMKKDAGKPGAAAAPGAKGEKEKKK